jgi:protoporphyrinogen oxidase
VLGDNINHNRRYVTILYKGRFVKYPFENDLAALDPQDRYDCLIGYLKVQPGGPPQNLEEWAYQTFGEGISDKYFLPYNRKIWNLEPRDIGLEFVARIPKPPMEDVVRSALGISTEGYTHQLNFRYPRKGGFQALADALVKDPSRVICNAPVERIRRDGRGWKVRAGGQDRRYDEVVIAFPIHDAVKCLDDPPPELLATVEALRYNSMRVTMVAVNNESLLDRNAVYVPDPEVLPNRICYMGSFSRENIRPGMSSLIAEVTMRPDDPLTRMPLDAYTDRILDDLQKLDLIKKSDVIATETLPVKYAYPVYDLHYTENVTKMRAWFASQGLHLLGRFAEFEYINSDECIHRAMQLAQRLHEKNLRPPGPRCPRMNSGANEQH